MSIKALLIPSLNQAPRRALLPDLEAGTSIPRILHQTFYDRVLPERIAANVARLRAQNPGWEYRFYDDDDIAAFIQAHYLPVVWETFRKIDPRYGAARADLFRYLLIYKVGGVYLDIKSGTTRPLDEVLRADDRFILSQWNTADGQYDYWGRQHDLRHVDGGEFQQWHVIGAPGHPFMKAVIEQVLSNIGKYDPYLHETGRLGVLRLTGPMAYTIAIDRIRAHHPHRIVRGHDELGLDYNVLARAEQTHVQAFKNHYTLQTAPVVRRHGLARGVSQLYRLAQYCHDRLHRRTGRPTST